MVFYTCELRSYRGPFVSFVLFDFDIINGIVACGAIAAACGSMLQQSRKSKGSCTPRQYPLQLQNMVHLTKQQERHQ